MAAGRIEQIQVWRGKQISLFLGTLQPQPFVLTKFVLLPCGLFSCCCEPLLNIVFLFHIQNKPRGKPENTAHTRKEEKNNAQVVTGKGCCVSIMLGFQKPHRDMVLSSLALLWARGLDQIISRASCQPQWCVGTKNCSQLFAVCRAWAASWPVKKPVQRDFQRL